MSFPQSLHHHVVIVGGGITGLSAAWYLQMEAQVKGLNLSYVLLEQSDRWGGKILTEETRGDGKGSFIVEGGPDSFITQKPWAFQLTHELGIADRLLPTNDHMRKVFVLNKGRPTPLPEGVLLIVPTKFRPFALSPLLSPLGKLRMGMDLFIPARRDGKDETLAQFIRRRLGEEALDKIAEPLMSGIYNSEAEKQSLLATFPRFRSLEEKHGSLIKGMIASQRARTKAPKPSPNGRPKPASMFISFRSGMRELVRELRSRLTGDCRLETAVQSISSAMDGGYELALSDGDRISADAVILAVPAYVAASLVQDLAPEAARDLDGIRYVSTGTISLAYKRDQIAHPLNGFGLVIPRSEQRAINAITWTSTKFAHRAPEGHVLLRIFFGGSRKPEMIDVSDTELVNIVRNELEGLLGIDVPPTFHRTYRWRRANPQYDVGHLERVKAIEKALPDGLYVTGSPYRGIGIPDCVHQAQLAARKIAERAVIGELAATRRSLLLTGI
jgi:oxygen-dependent protoporphyrinogen oxidase